MKTISILEYDSLYTHEFYPSFVIKNDDIENECSLDEIIITPSEEWMEDYLSWNQRFNTLSVSPPPALLPSYYHHSDSNDSNDTSNGSSNDDHDVDVDSNDTVNSKCNNDNNNSEYKNDDDDDHSLLLEDDTNDDDDTIIDGSHIPVFKTIQELHEFNQKGYELAKRLQEELGITDNDDNNNKNNNKDVSRCASNIRVAPYKPLYSNMKIGSPISWWHMKDMNYDIIVPIQNYLPISDSLKSQLQTYRYQKSNMGLWYYNNYYYNDDNNNNNNNTTLQELYQTQTTLQEDLLHELNHGTCNDISTNTIEYNKNNDEVVTDIQKEDMISKEEEEEEEEREHATCTSTGSRSSSTTTTSSSDVEAEMSPKDPATTNAKDSTTTATTTVVDPHMLPSSSSSSSSSFIVKSPRSVKCNLFLGRRNTHQHSHHHHNHH